MSNTLRESVAKVKAAYDICDVVESEGVSLKGSSVNEYVGLCPFHSEKTPSFKVNEVYQTYHCFGCGESGDVIEFTSKTRGLSFSESLLFLAKEKNIEIDFGNYKKDDGPKIDLNRIFKLVSDANDFYTNEYNKLDDSHLAKQEIIKRGLNQNKEVYGYAPEKYGALYEHLKSKGYTEEEMLQSELISEKNGKYYDFFYGRLLFTLSDFTGKPVSFSSRKIFENDNRGKYVNGKESPIFKKNTNLYNLHNAKRTARDKKEMIISEGQFDIEAISESLVLNVVGSSGTAFTEGHVKVCRQLVGESGSLIFAFDGDLAGVEAAKKVFTNFPIIHGVSKVVLFPENMDPSDYKLKYGAEALKDKLTEGVPLIDFILSQSLKDFPITDVQSRYTFIKEVVNKYLIITEDKMIFEYMLRKTSVMSGVGISEIRELVIEASNKAPKKREPVKVEKEEEELHVLVEINENDKSDMSYVKAFSLLASNPQLLVPNSKGIFIPDKFNPFLAQIIEKVKEANRLGESLRFIPEFYDDIDFAKLLQKEGERSIKIEEEESLINQYRMLLQQGADIYESNNKRFRDSEILTAMNEATSNEEIIELLKLREKMRNGDE